MSESNHFPPGWATTTLGNIHRWDSRCIIPHKWADQCFELYSVPGHATGSPELLHGREIGSNKQVVSPDAVLLCKINPRINRVWVVGSKGRLPQIASTEWIIFNLTPGIDPHYLAYYLRQDKFRNFLATNASGVGGSLMRIKPTTLRDYPFFIAPLNEQRRIVAKLEEVFSDLDAGIAALKRAKANLKRYRAAVLKAAVEGRLTAEWRAKHPHAESATKLLDRILAERRRRWEAEQEEKFTRAGSTQPKNWREKYPEPTPPDTTDLPPVPDGWCWASVAQLLVESPQNGAYYPKSRYGTGTAIVRIEDYQQFWSRSVDEVQRVDAPDEDQITYGLAANDLLINRVNSMTHLGKAMLVERRHLPAIYESNMMRLRPFTPELSAYLREYLRSNVGSRRLTSRAKWAVNQASINQQDVQATPVALPPLSEQKQIVSEIERQISVIQASECQIDADLQRAARLRQSILKRAFEGKLVPQDPSDEPASILLERIKAERQAAGGNDVASHKARRARKEPT